MIDAIKHLSPRAELLTIGLISFGSLVIGAGVMIASGERSYDYTTARVASSLLFELIAGTVAIAILRIRGWTSKELPVRLTPQGTVRGVGLWLVTSAVVWLAFRLTSPLHPALEWPPVAIHMTAWPPLMFAFVLVHSFYEEIFVTGYLVGRLRGRGPAVAVTVSALVRVLYYGYQGPMVAITVLPLGILFGLAYWRWRNLWPLVFAHTILNLLALGRAGE